MKNYISVNMKYSKAAAYLKIMEHNLRLAKIAYLKNKQDLAYGDNVHIEYATLEHLQAKREQQKSKFATKTQSNENEICEFVIALSEEQFKKCSKQEIVEHLKKLVEIYKKKWGFEPISLDLHLDEGNGENTNIHAHFVAYNFDFKKNKSILRTLKKQDFEKMQDVGGEAFKDLGFIRGESKKKTNREHLPPQEYKQAKESQKTTNKKAFENELNKVIANILENSKTFGFFSENELIENIKKQLKFYAKTKFDFEEIKQKSNEIIKLFKEIELLKSEIELLKSDKTNLEKQNLKNVGTLKNELEKAKKEIEIFQKAIEVKDTIINTFKREEKDINILKTKIAQIEKEQQQNHIDIVE